jgi:hypothetical protein
VGRRWLTWLLGRSRLSGRELVVAGLGLMAVTVAVFGSHIQAGGFLSDDWPFHGVYDLTRAGGFDQVVSRFSSSPTIAHRPLFAVYLATRETIFDWHMHWDLAWLAAEGALMCLALYALLRTLRLEPLHAAIISTLVLVFPAADATRLWGTAGGYPLSIALYLFGTTLALRGLETSGRRAVALHAGAVAAYVLSVLLFEVTLVAILLSGLLYRVRAPWRSVLRRWPWDVTTVALLSLLVTLRSSVGEQPRQSSLEGALDHAGTIFDQSLTLLTGTAIPLGGGHRWVLVILVGVTLAGVWIGDRRAAGQALGAELRRWLWVVAGGAVALGAAEAIYVPAGSYYAPTNAGLGNRINALPSVGYVVLVYGLGVVGFMLVLGRRRRGVLVAQVGAASAAVLVGAAYVHDVRRDSHRYDRAFALGQQVLASIRRSIPDLPRHSTIYAFGQPIDVAPQIPVFETEWDLQAALGHVFNDGTLHALPGSSQTTFLCGPHVMTPQGPPLASAFAPPGAAQMWSAPYGRAVLVDPVTGRSEFIHDQAQCRSVRRRFPAGPMNLVAS